MSDPTRSERPDARQAAEALADAETRSRAAASRLPEDAHWFEVVWLAYIGGLVLAMVAPTPFNLFLIIGLVFGISMAMNRYQERYGVWVSGFRAGRTRIIAIVLSVTLLAIMLLVWQLRLQYGLLWPAPVGAVTAMLFAFVLGRLWMRAYRKETDS